MSETEERKVTVSGRLITNTSKINKHDKYKIIVVFDPDYVDQKKIDGYIKKLEALKKSACEEVFGKKKVKLTDWVIRYGEEPDFENTFERYFISATSKKPFRNVKMVNGKPVDIEPSVVQDYIYAGAIVAVPLNVYAAVKKDESPNQVNLSPRGTICFLSHGEKLSSSYASDDEFEDFESFENDDDFDDDSF